MGPRAFYWQLLRSDRAVMQVPPPASAACPARAPGARGVSTSVRVVVVETEAGRSRLTTLDASLSADDRARIARMRFERDRIALTIAYGLHREVLAGVLGLAAHAVPLHRDALGRPRVADDPVWTSLSHAPGWVAIAVDARAPVGIDIEPCSRSEAVEEIADSVMHDAERACVAGSREGRCRALLGLWVRKEAVLKAAGVGLRVPMASFAIGVDGAVRVPGIAGRWQVQRLDVAAPVEVAIATLASPSVPGIATSPCRSRHAVTAAS